MRHLVLISMVTLGWCDLVWGERVIRSISWKEVKHSGAFPAGKLDAGPSDAGPLFSESLRIENPGGQPKTIQVFALDNPGITSLRYGVLGSVRYQDATPGTYLEMWSYFPNGEAFFSHTLDNSGPMQRIERSSDWRPFVLPFFSNEKAGSPKRLEVNVVFAGKGTVWLGPLRLVEYEANEDPLAVPGAWWSDRAAGFGGGLAGTIVGCLGGLIGTLTGLGKARRFVMTLAWVMVVAGSVSARP